MTSPLVSVVIPTHNYAQYLGEAIESVLAQDYSPLEIIVVDDGSTDDTRAVVDAFHSAGVTYVYQESAGPGAARNAGVELARGQVIAFLDADDAWLPQKTTMQMAHLQAYPELGLVGCGAFECDPLNRPEGIRRAPRIASAMAFEQLLVWNFVVPSGVLVRKRCLQEVGGFTDMRFGEDWDLWLRIAKVYPIGFVQEPLVKRRGHLGGLSFEIGVRLLDTYRAIGERYVDQAQPAWKRPLIRRRLSATAHYYAAGHAMTYSRRRVVRFVLASLWLDPATLPRAKAALLLRAALPDRAFGVLRKLRGRLPEGLPERL